MPELPREALKEAFHSSGEKNFHLAKLFYGLLIGSGWDFALLGFTYMKLLDDVIDEDPDTDRAVACLDDQRRLMEDVYSGRSPAKKALPVPGNYGLLVCRYDRACGSQLRQYFEDMIDTMEYDLRRRNRISTREELEDWAKKVGGVSIRYLAHFVSPRYPLSDHFVDLAGLAYLNADSLIDLEEDFAQGIFNIPSEEIETRGIELEMSDPGVRRWIAEESAKVMQLLDEAIEESKRVKSFKMRLLTWLYLSRKGKGLARFVERQGITSAAPPNSSGSLPKAPVKIAS
jgi:phytoene/squalene synthetase